LICCCNEEEDLVNEKEIESVIIHMHGGGFIALSSRMMQTMTRRWANKLKIPIFSIDYRKPPNNPFPAAPNDCLTVYKFIVNHINKYMNINPKNIYLAGDSAGGNLACSLTGNVIKNNLPIPKGIYAAYPALDLRVRFSPSRIHAISDPLLWPSMLLLCLHEYLGESV
jgi:hormone-sensitive lipase